ncbi:hypothetical protein [Paraburkholderia caffeinilytica]|uniref:hypothetical protein n=1 Tax=Paraburkholderia caffeinilytica TaxID=1761016 RepID=UPI0038BBDADC
MKTVEELLTEMETHVAQAAPARGHYFLVSGVTRIEIEQHKGVTRWLVNNRVCDRECAGRELEHARAYKYRVFVDYPPKKG